MQVTRTFVAAMFLAAIAVASALAEDWPGFRGSSGGVADAKDLPAEWTKENVLWKVPLPGPGASSPITHGDKLFVTCYTGYGTKISKGFKGGVGKGGFGKRGKGGKGGFGRGEQGAAGDQEKLRLMLVCLDGTKGQILWQKEVQPKLPEVPASGFLLEHGYASSTPITDGERIYVFFGKTGVLAFDMDGKQLWQTNVGTGTDKWGSAASPVLYKDLVIVNAAIESKALVALDKKTGKEVWRTGGLHTSWASPLLVETKDHKHEVVLSLLGKVASYDPETGKELWHCTGIGNAGGFGYTCSTPVARDGVVYIVGGGGPTTRPVALAVKTGGRGDVSASHVLWRKDAGTAISSPVLTSDCLCWVSGSATCLRTADGTVAHKERLYDARSEYVSPVAAGDKVLALTRFEGMYVFSAGKKFEQLGHLTFEGDDSIFNASPALSGGRVYLRSNAYLYCLGKKSS